MKTIRALLIDLDGVIYVEDRLIPGARESLAWLRSRGFPFRFLTNTTMRSRVSLAAKLASFGIHAEPEEVISTGVVAARWLGEHGHFRIQLLLPEDARQDFAGFELTEDHPEVVIVGDLGRDFNFDVLNRAFLSLRDGAKLVALQKNRFWQTPEGPALDVGPFVAALEYASQTEAILIGKPNRAYFEVALQDLHLPPPEVAMVGDDVETDIAGAAAVGARTILVRTGKASLETTRRGLSIEPDWTLDSIRDVPDLVRRLGLEAGSPSPTLR